MCIETYQRCPPRGGYHWRIRDTEGKVIDESQGAFYGDNAPAKAIAACERYLKRLATEFEAL